MMLKKRNCTGYQIIINEELILGCGIKKTYSIYCGLIKAEILQLIEIFSAIEMLLLNSIVWTIQVAALPEIYVSISRRQWTVPVQCIVLSYE